MTIMGSLPRKKPLRTFFRLRSAATCATLLFGLSISQAGVSVAKADPLIENVLISLSGTISVYHEPLMTAGKLSGCTFVFEHLTQDNKYLGGDFLRSSGSLGLMSAGDDQVALVVKVISAKIEAKSELTPVRFDLDRAYLVGPDNSSNFSALIASYESDRPGGVFAIYDLAKSAPQLFQIMEFGKATVAVAPPGGGMDVLLSLDLNVSDTNGVGERVTTSENMLKFNQCLQDLLD